MHTHKVKHCMVTHCITVTIHRNIVISLVDVPRPIPSSCYSMLHTLKKKSKKQNREEPGNKAVHIHNESET